MLIMKIWGGLGNQMFQYATAKALSMRSRQELKLDTSFYSQDSSATKRELQLSIFGETLHIATEKDLKKVLGLLFFKPFLKVWKRLLHYGFPSLKYLNDPDFVYNQRTEKISTDCYMEGYWQSYRYFENYRDVLLESFSFPEIIKKNVSEIANTIAGNVTASIHIRRGDYVSSKSTNDFHGVCDIAYYNSAIAYLKARYPDLYILVFSDDIEWVKEHLPVSGKHLYVTNGNRHPAEDMYLMSICNHNVIANSSFSWWAAWLNRNNNKVVIAPQKWFNTDLPTNDLIPAKWIRM